MLNLKQRVPAPLELSVQSLETRGLLPAGRAGAAVAWEAEPGRRTSRACPQRMLRGDGGGGGAFSGEESPPSAGAGPSAGRDLQPGRSLHLQSGRSLHRTDRCSDSRR